MDILAMALISLGLFFLVVSALGLVRLPDFFTRVHAVSKSETLGVSLILLGLIAFQGFDLVSLKLALAVLFVFLTNPLAAHVLTRAAVRRGLLPWRRTRPNAFRAVPTAIEHEGSER